MTTINKTTTHQAFQGQQNDQKTYGREKKTTTITPFNVDLSIT